eukprot:TRINITY_DN56022_c0_g1_i1.p1 TRINITY_DN56022_c0_g1~~TRINITY_DN56022_c0_g1_i1.p1  ORF type:complete len:204 (-),score=24.86 TRINITY_DN56022_c0_g1_i1:86-697(-)
MPNTVYFFFFKQKTAYEMLRSLVGSEMCIRDSPHGSSTTMHPAISHAIGPLSLDHTLWTRTIICSHNFLSNACSPHLCRVPEGGRVHRHSQAASLRPRLLCRLAMAKLPNSNQTSAQGRVQVRVRVELTSLSLTPFIHSRHVSEQLRSPYSSIHVPSASHVPGGSCEPRPHESRLGSHGFGLSVHSSVSEGAAAWVVAMCFGQ